ncbi:FG-GAP repeat protein [Streptomyces sp. NPDC102394]|uniref:FG-GAP repeat protein n=1 Tax=Streptomyces sp. NPDC102394 TaxID=3366167 RepID=UPI003800EF65
MSVADVDGDGYADVAVGAPGEDADGEAGAGAVSLMRGSQTGLTATGARCGWSTPRATAVPNRWSARRRRTRATARCGCCPRAARACSPTAPAPTRRRPRRQRARRPLRVRDRRVISYGPARRHGCSAERHFR